MKDIRVQMSRQRATKIQLGAISTCLRISVGIDIVFNLNSYTFPYQTSSKEFEKNKRKTKNTICKHKVE